MAAVEFVRERVQWCESENVNILCCPEAIIGGLADHAPHPSDFALEVDSGQLGKVLEPLASSAVTTVVGFTEIAAGRRLYNAAAVFENPVVIGIYRKLHPAINKSVYEAGGDPGFHG